MTTDEAPLLDWECCVCGAANEAMFDPELGHVQKFTEDCRVCCRPNLLRVRVRAQDEFEVTVEFDE